MLLAGADSIEVVNASPAALLVGVMLLLLAVAGMGYWLNKHQVNIAVLSIGVDFFQVLAIFKNLRIAWPPQILELFRILSAFNLNIEIVAPECIVPNLSYRAKFWFIMLLPLSVGALLGALCYATYDFTNQATLARWPTYVTAIDVCWGASATMTAAVAATYAARAFAG